jgi:hypothetical protein
MYLVLNIVAEWLTLLLHMWEFSGSNLGPGTGYSEYFHGFVQPLQANAGIVT